MTYNRNTDRPQTIPEATTSRDRSSISSDSSPASTVNYSAAYSSDPAAEISHTQQQKHYTLKCKNCF